MNLLKICSVIFFRELRSKFDLLRNFIYFCQFGFPMAFKKTSTVLITSKANTKN